MTQHIFVTGGVCSSLGKGLTAASIGCLLERRGFSIQHLKLDPYINVDPGTMNPFQHGEVYVTEDGAETDLDLGHYERFTNAKITKKSNMTTGAIYDHIIRKERRGEFLGGTVQVIPHVTDAIKESITRLAGDNLDFVITEIGGTIGDIESLPFLEAIRQVAYDWGRENVFYIHLTLVPYLHAAQEVKTKPTQHSVQTLRQIGIIPDMLICRTEVDLEKNVREKIALFCNVPLQYVIEEKDVKNSIYEVPKVFFEQGVTDLIVKRLGREAPMARLDDWDKMLADLISPVNGEVTISVVGKYIDLQDAYKSIYEALTHGGIANSVKVRLNRVNSDDLINRDPEKLLEGSDGILVPGGFGIRGVEGKIEAARFARENRIPYFGICLGMQVASIEIARNLLGIHNATSKEFDNEDNHEQVITLMDEQRNVTDMGGTMRLGAYPCHLAEGSRSRAAYGKEIVYERHRHRYEFHGGFRERFEQAGVAFAGLSPDKKLVEIIEIKDHPWYVASQFHPEFKSKPTGAHPLFTAFVKAAVERRDNVQKP